jgi:hypothetical protein
MHRDEIVDEVRRIREEYVASLDYDLDKIVQDLKKGEAKSGHKVVSPPPKRIMPSPEKESESGPSHKFR